MDASKRSAAIDRLEAEVKKLRVDYERFFNGDLDVPPDDMVDKIRRRIAELRGRRNSNIDNFRLSGIEAGFSAYAEMFTRRLRTRERKGTPRRAPVRTAAVVDLNEGIVFGDSFDAEKVTPLYRRLYQEGDRKPVDPDTFASYLARQHKLIRDRSGCAKVRFRIVEENGKAKLKAKPEA